MAKRYAPTSSLATSSSTVLPPSRYFLGVNKGKTKRSFSLPKRHFSQQTSILSLSAEKQNEVVDIEKKLEMWRIVVSDGFKYIENGKVVTSNAQFFEPGITSKVRRTDRKVPVFDTSTTCPRVQCDIERRELAKQYCDEIQTSINQVNAYKAELVATIETQTAEIGVLKDELDFVIANRNENHETLKVELETAIQNRDAEIIQLKQHISKLEQKNFSAVNEATFHRLSLQNAKNNLDTVVGFMRGYSRDVKSIQAQFFALKPRNGNDRGKVQMALECVEDGIHLLDVKVEQRLLQVKDLMDAGANEEQEFGTQNNMQTVGSSRSSDECVTESEAEPEHGLESRETSSATSIIDSISNSESNPANTPCLESTAITLASAVICNTSIDENTTSLNDVQVPQQPVRATVKTLLKKPKNSKALAKWNFFRGSSKKKVNVTFANPPSSFSTKNKHESKFNAYSAASAITSATPVVSCGKPPTSVNPIQTSSTNSSLNNQTTQRKSSNAFHQLRSMTSVLRSSSRDRVCSLVVNNIDDNNYAADTQENKTKRRSIKYVTKSRTNSKFLLFYSDSEDEDNQESSKPITKIVSGFKRALSGENNSKPLNSFSKSLIPEPQQPEPKTKRNMSVESDNSDNNNSSVYYSGLEDDDSCLENDPESDSLDKPIPKFTKPIPKPSTKPSLPQPSSLARPTLDLFSLYSYNPQIPLNNYLLSDNDQHLQFKHPVSKRLEDCIRTLKPETLQLQCHELLAKNHGVGGSGSSNNNGNGSDSDSGNGSGSAESDWEDDEDTTGSVDNDDAATIMTVLHHIS